MCYKFFWLDPLFETVELRFILSVLTELNGAVSKENQNDFVLTQADLSFIWACVAVAVAVAKTTCTTI